MTTSNDIPLGANPINRAAHRRTDSNWQSEAIKQSNVLICLIQDGNPFVDGANLVWLGPQALSLSDKKNIIFLGEDKSNTPVFSIELPKDWSFKTSPILGLGEFVEFRSVAGAMPLLESNCIATARSLFEWHKSHQFCSRCGNESKVVDAGWKRNCNACNTEHFPRSDPVAIMLAVKEDQCLLGRGPYWPKRFMSCLAGFIEPGETIEQAAVRELHEETGIIADPVAAKYQFSQPWPFPSSLMVGLIIPAITDEIKVDASEIEEARWFSRQETQSILTGTHPDLNCPPPIAIAHHLMKEWAFGDHPTSIGQ